MRSTTSTCSQWTLSTVKQKKGGIWFQKGSGRLCFSQHPAGFEWFIQTLVSPGSQSCGVSIKHENLQSSVSARKTRTFKDGRTCSPRLRLNVPEGFASFPETGVLIRLVGNEAFFEPKYETNLLPKDEGDGLILAFISSESERLCHCSVEGDFTLFKEEVRNIEVHLWRSRVVEPVQQLACARIKAIKMWALYEDCSPGNGGLISPRSKRRTGNMPATHFNYPQTMTVTCTHTHTHTSYVCVSVCLFISQSSNQSGGKTAVGIMLIKKHSKLPEGRG